MTFVTFVIDSHVVFFCFDVSRETNALYCRRWMRNKIRRWGEENAGTCILSVWVKVAAGGGGNIHIGSVAHGVSRLYRRLRFVCFVETLYGPLEIGVVSFLDLKRVDENEVLVVEYASPREPDMFVFESYAMSAKKFFDHVWVSRDSIRASPAIDILRIVAKYCVDGDFRLELLERSVCEI